MQRLIVIPDSFKGTISSIEICEIVKQKAQLIFPDCEVVAIPVADGGEGTVDCFLQAMDGKKVHGLSRSTAFMECLEKLR